MQRQSEEDTQPLLAVSGDPVRDISHFSTFSGSLLASRRPRKFRSHISNQGKLAICGGVVVVLLLMTLVYFAGIYHDALAHSAYNVYESWQPPSSTPEPSKFVGPFPSPSQIPTLIPFPPVLTQPTIAISPRHALADLTHLVLE